MTNKNNKLDKNDSQIVQLKPQTKQIASALALASCGLFASNGHATELAKNIDDWKVDAALMYYGEQDRVQAIEAIGTAQKNFGDDSVLDLKLVVDSLTGASASGAVAQSNSQTFTRPSGNGQYTVAAGETPLDDTFHDTRVQANANWSQVLNPDWKVNGGVYASKEFDYMSMGINAGVERGFNKDNTTLFLGTSYSFDVVDPVGGRPVALSTMAIRDNFTSDEAYRSAFDATRQTSSDNKQTADLMLGITQILNQRWLLQANYGLSSVSGYLTDPYKVLSVVDNNGTTENIVYENRPDSRLKHSFYMMTKGALDSGVVDFSYRYTTDDWDLTSHTLETHYRYYFSGSFYGQLHLRYYQQAAVNFYQPFLMAESPLPEFASADYRIGDMSAYTVGVKFGHRLSGGHEMTYRLEYYQQDPKNNGTELPGQLQNYDLFPTQKAITAQFSYSF
ncbi:DUF3570 domain-containing protein [Shewanella xiamenensis]|jgi:hypothetical protein|uniref:DUF3570 domain-containing protein n=1 Tax=Shewanella xiamenensis TaxID=332186 RepID=A0ABT6UBB8_9GAMM|nr:MULTISPECIES: DUF3570 domain-containing protein [Shewanella]PZP34134.1 MAG: DUF3570 domain-containing protein [Shewanella oneidensis]KPN75816.1 hypothetical protein AEA42_17160 [Shewanella sp. Sh95]MCH7421358.1 DUF3570 domain-containing protein [Shewanella sp. MM_2022_3]MCL1070584.1 DUF3570 domain-containing protein [Shewanella xiamenensis]MCR4535340.1 DUF3570 domain-containing protein [Shewanella xiamenensis]